MKYLLPFFILTFAFSANALELDLKLVETRLYDGEKAIASRNFEAAVTHCKAGLDNLGGAYHSSEIVDDSGMKLFAASLQVREGKSNNAASIYCKILSERLSQYKRKLSRGK